MVHAKITNKKIKGYLKSQNSCKGQSITSCHY